MGVWEGLEIKKEEERRKTRMIGTGTPCFQTTSGQSLSIGFCYTAHVRAPEESNYLSGSGTPFLLERPDPLKTPFIPYLFVLVPR